jgi:peptidoglycan/xylan/chitin deacetylase (PgdA/CDA1 family)
MNLEEMQARRMARAREREAIVRRRRQVAALLGGGLVVVIVVAIALASSGSGGATPSPTASGAGAAHGRVHGRAHANGRSSGSSGATHSGSTVTGSPTGKPGSTPVPVLMYHVIAAPPPGAPFPGLYVPASEFAAQMQALKAAGWHAVTLDQVRAYWTKGVPLGPGKPIVLTFDNGYHSQYANALPVLQQLHWVADENIQLTGLPPSQGGLTSDEVKAMVKAGWELDTQGISHADLVALTPSELTYQVATARKMIQQQYGVPVNWFCYPSGHYNATVIAEVKSAGYVGSTTVIPGWASPHIDPYTLPRLRVLGGTSPQALLSQIAQAQTAGPPPASYGT